MKVTKEELKKLYEENTVSDVMVCLGIRSPSSLYRLLNRAGITRKRPDTSPRVRSNVELVD